MQQSDIRVIDAEGYYSEQFLCRQAPPTMGGREEILDLMFLAVNLISDHAPKKLQSTVLDASTEVSGIPTQLKLRGFQNVIGVPAHDDHRDALAREFKAEGWAGNFASVTQREIPAGLGLQEAVDVVTFMDSSFGQFANRSSQLGTLRSVAANLSDDGVIVLDLSNPIERIRNIAWQPVWSEGPTAWVLTRETIDPTTFEYVTTIITIPKNGGAGTESSERGTLLPLPILREILEEANLTIRKVYGNYERDPYGPDSTRMIVIVGKA